MTWSCDRGNYSSSPVKDLSHVCRNCCFVCMVRPRDAKSHFMNLTTCVCVCVYICMYICMYIYMYMYIYIYIYIYIHIYTHTHTHIRDTFYIFSCSCAMNISDSDLV